MKELVRAESRQGRRHIAPGDETFFAAGPRARDLRDHAQREDTGRGACGGAPALCSEVMEVAEKHQVVTLSSLADGAALELFQNELGRVVENILDPNTDPEAARKVVLEVRIKPQEDREQADVEVKVKATLAGIRGARTRFFLGRDHGQCVAIESNPKQQKLFQTPEIPATAPARAAQETR
jgi:hypothetical protein